MMTYIDEITKEFIDNICRIITEEIKVEMPSLYEEGENLNEK